MRLPCSATGRRASGTCTRLTTTRLPNQSDIRMASPPVPAANAAQARRTRNACSASSASPVPRSWSTSANTPRKTSTLSTATSPRKMLPNQT
jgi:hypothetical protein